MNLKEFLETERERKELFFYLLDCQEWIILMNEKEDNMVVTKYKNGFFKRLKAGIVYLNKEYMIKAFNNYNNVYLLINKVKPGLKYLLEEMTKREIDIILFDNYCPVTIDELIDIYNDYIYDYFNDTVKMIEKVENKNFQLVQYSRLMLMLPNIYMLVYEDDESLAIEERIMYKEKKKVAYIFSSREEAIKYMKKHKIMELGIKPKCYRQIYKISSLIKSRAEYIVLDAKHLASTEGIKNLEKLILES